MSELLTLDAHALRDGFLAKHFSPAEVLEEVFCRVEAIVGLNAFAALDFERATAEARAVTTRYLRGEEARRLAGVPIAVKDMIDTAGLTTTYGSSMFRDHVPNMDATVVARARAEGAIIIGKTNTHEFAWGITTDNPHYGPTRNPWDCARTSGGSSGGSAVAVASGAVPLALGSDTGGSVRIPAALCGVLGLKPTRGRASLSGVFPLAPTLDHVGVLARTSRDAALLLSVIAGRDTKDPSTARMTGMLSFSRDGTSEKLRIGHDSKALAELPQDLTQGLSQGLALLERGGALLTPLEPVDVPMKAFGVLQGAEAYRVHTRAGLFPTRRQEYGSDVRERLERAATVSIEDYLSAMDERMLLCATMTDHFEEVDVILSPAGPTTPPLIGSSQIFLDNVPFDFRDAVMPFSVVQNLTGLPACSVPAGRRTDGMPLAVQVTGRPGQEDRVLSVAKLLIDATADRLVQDPR